MMKRLFILFSVFLFLISTGLSFNNSVELDTLERAKQLLQDARVKAEQKEIEITIRNIDISKFPEINIIIEAFNNLGQPLDSIDPRSLTVMENEIEKKVLSVRKLSVNERVPVDFIFIIDKTGTMQNYMNGVMANVSGFANSLISRGIDYKLGLILFTDTVDEIYQPTNNVLSFLNWLKPVKATGGYDPKENALEALEAAAREIKYRPSANKVVVLITDAPYHQKGEKGGWGITDQTTSSIIDTLNKHEIRVFSIVPPQLKEYYKISERTRGKVYDIDFSFSTILDNFSNQLTNLFALKYLTELQAIPDSINISLLNEQKQELVRKTIPIVELGRKLIIENLLYETNSAVLSDSVPELNVLYEFMHNKQNVKILVEGHTDSRGSDALNDALSLKRAESVKEYLVRKGIAPERIDTKGYGKRKPIASNNTAFGMQLNRRTEIVIIAK